MLLGLLCPGPALAQTADAGASGDKRVAIVRVATAPVIDGIVEEAVWSAITPIHDLHQVNPVEYAEPSELTEIRIAYDDNALYVSARLWDSQPDQITARVLRQGESLGSEDRFAIIIDPNLDRRSGYRFQMNPNAVRWDALYSDASSLESDWDGIWEGAATRDNGGWTAEIAIPFKTLSFDPNSEAWGLNFERNIKRNDEKMAWVSRNRQMNPGVAGTVVGFESLQQGRGLDVVPSISATGQRSFAAGSSSTTDVEPSLDIFYKFTPSLNGALTLNTDFSATEIDDRQVNLTRFSLFFPEKRDFFLQDVDIFEFGRIGGRRSNGRSSGSNNNNGMPFFSRRLGLSPAGEPLDINVGGKLSGRMGRFNVGMLLINQEGVGDLDTSNVMVGRISANVLGESSVGVIYTNGDPLSDIASSTMGTDFNYRNTRLPGGKVVEANAWYQQTDTAGVTGDDRAFGFGISAPNNTGWHGGIASKQLERNFDPAVGFVNETGIRNMTGNVEYRYRYADAYVRTVNIGISGSRTDRLETGQLDRQRIQIGLDMESRTQDRILVDVSRHKENIPADFPIYSPSDGSDQVVIPAGSYAWSTAAIDFRSGNQRKLSIDVRVGAGGYYDGESMTMESEVTWRPSRRLRLAGGYSYREVDLPGGSFEVRQTDLSLQFAFSATLSWVNLIQYDNFSEIVGFNSRLHWIPVAGREGFIVFNHNIEDRDKNDSFHATNADLSVKFSYTWRF